MRAEGAHYLLERCGLDRQALYAEYAEYIEHFGIPLERASGRGTSRASTAACQVA